MLRPLADEAKPYRDRVKLFNFALSAHVFRSAIRSAQTRNTFTSLRRMNATHENGST